jgi:hypothetical protein
MTEQQDGTGRLRAANPWLVMVGTMALLAGIATGAVALAAVVGVWTQAWNFQRGFELLGAAHSWGPTVAVSAAVVAALVLVAGRVLSGRLLLLPPTLALLGAGAAALAWYIPESHRPPEDANIPPIHDIATDVENPPQFVDVLPLRVDAANTTDYGNYPNMTPQRLGEMTRAAYPDLVTQRLDVPPAQAFDRALEAVERLGWDLVAAVPDEGRIEATDTTFWFRFKDDVVIRIRPSGDGGSLVDARSTSRVGLGDVGTNARRLRAFFERLGV